jgi:hypothetical protein
MPGVHLHSSLECGLRWRNRLRGGAPAIILSMGPLLGLSCRLRVKSVENSQGLPLWKYHACIVLSIRSLGGESVNVIDKKKILGSEKNLSTG